MKLMPGSERIIAGDDTDHLDGNVRWAPAKSLWIGAMTAVALALGPPLFSWDALILLVATSALALCFGHSVGMHRRLIHNSFECPLWVEHFCVYLGTLVGMPGRMAFSGCTTFATGPNVSRCVMTTPVIERAFSATHGGNFIAGLC